MNIKVDQKRFDAVKIMFESGATIAEVAKYMGVSDNTAKRIKKADTFTEYKDMLAAIALEYKNKKIEKKKIDVAEQQIVPEAKPQEVKLPGGQMSYNYHLTRMFEMLRQMNENLVQISNKMAYIVEELTSTPAAK